MSVQAARGGAGKSELARGSTEELSDTPIYATAKIDLDATLTVREDSPKFPPPVPAWSERILIWVTDSERRLEVLGDLEELYHKRVQQRGEAEAIRWYRHHAAAAAVHFLFQAATRLMVVLRKLDWF